MKSRAETQHRHYLKVVKPRRQAASAARKNPPPALCAQCHERPVMRPATGRPGVYCSPACRTKAWRARTKAPA